MAWMLYVTPDWTLVEVAVHVTLWPGPSVVVPVMDGLQLAPLIDAILVPPGPIMFTVTPVAARLPVF